MAAVPGLRDRKKVATRVRITEAAMALFLKQGFEATTVDDIAAAADISRRSFFNHFASKEDVAAAWQDGTVAVLAAEIASRPADEAPIDMARNALLGLVKRHDPREAQALAEFSHRTPALKAREAAKYQGLEDALRNALAARTDRKSDDLELRIVAAVAISLLRIASDYWVAPKRRESMIAYGERIFATLRSAVSASRGD
ncbi:Putative mycofactocin biosynthesis transcriptional regulator MftR [Alphaproteobacteria bacterium SO-S41]|nr:Putative mycofactocin biosynthesis transcriptional regulator MftR [Alphaproteobacteria bacterium SO-S41]